MTARAGSPTRIPRSPNSTSPRSRRDGRHAVDATLRLAPAGPEPDPVLRRPRDPG